jgi:flagellar basal body-associated protein FliL
MREQRPGGLFNGSRKEHRMSLLWIILIVVLVLALLGFFGRGRF